MAWNHREPILLKKNNPEKKLPQVSDTKLLVPRPENIRTYCEKNLSRGFSCIMIKNVKFEYVICEEIIFNGCMKPLLLTCHLQTKYSDFKVKKYFFFILLKNNYKCNICFVMFIVDHFFFCWHQNFTIASKTCVLVKYFFLS